jgi:transposase
MTIEVVGFEPFFTMSVPQRRFNVSIINHFSQIMPMKNTKSKRIKANTVRVDHRNIVGIDIGKRKHAATAITPKGIPIASLAHFENNREGVALLERQVLIPATNRSKPMIAMEATGAYWNALHDELERRGYSCVVLNPIQTGQRGQQRIRRTKTDRLDSELIARTILAGDAQSTLVPDEPMFEMRLLVRHRWRLLKIHGMVLRYAIGLMDRVFPEYEDVFCKPFLSSVRTLIHEVGLTPDILVANKAKVRATLERASRKKLSPDVINELLKRAAKSIGTRQGMDTVNAQVRMGAEYLDFVEKQIEQIDDELRARMEELQSPVMSLGIGPVIAATILAESAAVEKFAGPREYSAFCGLDPSEFISGDSIMGISHISKRGSPLLRWALYMAAQTVVKKHHDFARIYERHLKNQPKAKRQKGHRYALVAVAHKVARVIWRLMKDGREFTKRPPKQKN